MIERDEKDPTALGREVHELLAGVLSPEDCGEEAQLLAQAFSRSELGLRVAAAPRSFRERNLLFPVGGRLLRGQIDLWFADDEGSVLLDYKTDQVDAGAVASKAATYAVQLQLYARALELSGAFIDLHLVHTLHREFDRILGRHDVHIRLVDLRDRRVQGVGLATSSRTRHQD